MALAYTAITKTPANELDENLDIYVRETTSFTAPTDSTEEAALLATMKAVGHVYKEDFQDPVSSDVDEVERIDGTSSPKKKELVGSFTPSQSTAAELTNLLTLDKQTVDLLVYGETQARIYRNVILNANVNGGRAVIGFKKKSDQIGDTLTAWAINT